MIRRNLTLAVVVTLFLVGCFGCANQSTQDADQAHALALRLADLLGRASDVGGLSAAEAAEAHRLALQLADASGRVADRVHVMEAAIDLLRAEYGITVVVPVEGEPSAGYGTTAGPATTTPYDDGEWRRAPVRDRATDALEELQWRE